MEIVRFYETVVHDQEHGFAASITILPSSYLPDVYDPADPQEVLRTLDMEPIGRVRAGQLINALASVLSPEAWSSSGESGIRPDWTVKPSREKLAFAEFLTFAKHVPFENSPLSGESIGSLIAEATAGGVGAFVGFVITAGTPLVLIAVPGGMILFMASAGIAPDLEHALRDGIRRRVSDALKSQNNISREA